MKKIKQRSGDVWVMVGAVILLYFASIMAWTGFTHHGPGWWTFGGDQPGTGGQVSVPEHDELISEIDYKREDYLGAIMLGAMGFGFLWTGIKSWKDQNDLENSWERTIKDPNSVQDIIRRPELYRDDFRKWIRENHPNVLLPAGNLTAGSPECPKPRN